MRFLLIIIFLICYGSLYPFNFELSHPSEVLIQKLFDFKFYKQTYADIISNVILFIPFGFLAAKSLKNGRISLTHSLFINFVAFAFAFLIQVVQLWTPERVPSGSDAIWNVLGCFVGVLLAKLHFSSLNKDWETKPPINQIYLYLGFLLILINWTPFVPSLDFGTVINNLKSLIFERKISVYWVCEKATLWLVCFHFLKKSDVFQLKAMDFLTIVFVTLAVKVFIADSPLTIDHIFGAMLGCVLWNIGQRFITDKIVAILLVLLIVSLSLYPFVLNANTQDFSWLPFSGALNGNIMTNILAMVKKFALYACVVWAMYVVTKRMLFSSLVVSLIIFICEYAQIYLVQSVPEITDALLVLIAGYSLYRYLQRSSEAFAGIQTSIAKPTIQPEITAPSPSLVSHNTIPALDGLRAVAAISVFIVHFYQEVELTLSLGVFDISLWMFNSNTGVALFFILSGFLLSMPFWLNKINNDPLPNVKQYFLRRAVRILPAYYVCLFGVLCAKLLMGNSLNFNNVISHIFFLHNHKDYQVLDLNPPFWSLAVEVQFYLFLPLLFFIVSRIKFTFSLLVFGAAVPVFYLIYLSLMKALIAANLWPIHFPLIWPFGVSLESASGAALRYATLAHLPHFLLGATTAAIFILKSHWLSQKTTLSEVVFWVSGLAIFVILSTPLDQILQVDYGRYNFPYVPVLLAAVILTVPFSYLGKFILERPTILWVGKLSYGIYLYHYLVLKGVGRLFNKFHLDINNHMLLFALVSFLLSVIVAYLSYRFIEAPIIQRVKSSNIVLSNTQNRSEYKNSITTKMPTRSGTNSLILNKRALQIVLACLIIAISFTLFNSNFFKPNETKQYSWASNDTNIIFDHHTHSNFSDGKLEIAELTKLASENGCDAFAMTDHSSSELALSTQRLDEIKLARILNPDVMVISGVELNPPSYDGREHVNALFSIEQENIIFAELSEKLKIKKPALTDQTLFQFLANYNLHEENVLAIYNHPSRKDIRASENKTDFLNWISGSNIFIGISGAPGHQKSEDIGSYRGKFKPIHRWDPVVANVGGTLDQLLDEGHNVWGAIASSDYHNSSMDYAPCEFSRIHVSAPQKSYEGLFSALKAGTFWASHGKFLSKFALSAEISERYVIAFPGDNAEVKVGDVALITVNVNREKEFFGLPLKLDLITNCVTGEPKSLEPLKVPAFNNQVSALMPLISLGSDDSSCYLRSRLEVKSPNGEIFQAYSNHIRLFLN